MRIGVAITVHNRNEIAAQTLTEWKRFLPEGAKLVVVDDASETPFPDSDFRFEINAGIAKAKNKCIELLEDCEYIFLSDDDCFPVTGDWFMPYIESGHTHLSMTFCRTAGGKPNGRNLIKTLGGISEYSKPCGCLLFIHKSVIEKIGGLDEGYGKWGMEHVDFSNRAYNAGASQVRFGDIQDSLRYFRSLDHEGSVRSSTNRGDKLSHLKRNRDRFTALKDSKRYIPYKDTRKPSESVVIGSYFNYTQDPQRKKMWDSDINKVLPLKRSVETHGEKCIILHDCLQTEEDGFVVTQGDPDFTPNAFRWFAQMEWIEQNNPESVFMVDSTDVIMLRSPFPEIHKGRLYCGYEYNQTMMSKWMWRTQGRYLRIRDWGRIMRLNNTHVLLNCGVFGGETETVLGFLRVLCAYHEKHSRRLKTSSDMSMFNYVAMKHFKDKIVTGELVTTKFKQNETNEISWFKHK